MQRYKSNLRRTVEIILIGTLTVAAIATFLWWTNERDKALNEWATKYEECVKVEYHTTPSAWYAEHGEYPECDVSSR